jgi:hypothetical protein
MRGFDVTGLSSPDMLSRSTRSIVLAVSVGISVGVGLYTFVYARGAQFYIDFLISENSMGFHASQYSIKSLAEAIDFCRKGQNSLRQLRGVKQAGVSAGNASGGK